MNKRLVRSFLPALLVMFPLLASSVSAQNNYMVSAGAAGHLKIGMTVDEARKALPGHIFARTSDGEGIALVEVRKGKNMDFTLYAGEEDPEMPVDFSSVIEQIEIWSPAYRTKDGIGPGMTLVDVQKKYGPLKGITLSEIEAREYAEFENGPKDITFRLEGAGIFEGGSNKTTHFRKGSKIRTLIITGDGSESNIGFYSDYTDLDTACKTKGPDGEGSHVSTYCEGPDGFRVHMFDTAMTLEINVESPDPSKAVSVASESLGFSTKGMKLEWRYKQGIPFAVIFRGNKYKAGDDGLIKYTAEVTGEYLFVRGLPGFEEINAEVNVRTTKFANEEARKIVDEGYIKIKFPVADYVRLEIADQNLVILTAAGKGESWVKSPMQVSARVAGEFAEMKTRKMLIEAPSGEGADSFTLTVINEGLLDDSVRSEKFVYELFTEANGVWKLASAKKAWSCWPGRGHEDFSAVPCI